MLKKENAIETRKLLSFNAFRADEEKYKIEEGLWLTAFEESAPLVKQ